MEPEGGAGRGWATRLGRRHGLALAASAMLPRPSAAELAGDIHFVPGGRLGFRRPPEIGVWSNHWILLSTDHTLSVKVQEALRLGPSGDSHLWEKDAESRRIAPDPAPPGFEVRRFRYLGYGDSPDYAAESVVLRDAEWMGQVEVENGSQAGLARHPGGQNRRWEALRRQVLDSVAIRPRLPVAAALAELHAELDTEGLNPRLVGEELILSRYTPRNAEEAWGANAPTVRLQGLMLTLPLSPEDVEAAIEDAGTPASRARGLRVLRGNHCRGVVQPELTFAPGAFSTKIQVYGRTRSAELVAFYGARDRWPVLDALDRAFRSLRLPDVPRSAG